MHGVQQANEFHSYQPLWPEDRSDWKPPSPADFMYRDALDVGHFAAVDALTTWHTCPHIWHLDANGRWRYFMETSISHGPRAADGSFDPQPGDWLAVGDDDEPPCRTQVVRRNGNRVWVRLDLALSLGIEHARPPRPP